MNILIGAVLAGLLAQVVHDDLRRYVIRNGVVLALLALFAVDMAVRASWPDVVQHVLFGGAVFALLLACYALGAMGGGDVKLLSVAFLWFGLWCAGAFATALLIVTILYSGLGALGVAPVRRTPKGMVIPFGPSIAVAWAATHFLLC
ncbi:prepilin peptidase [Alsobacter sp. SYSU M60028]|uniref:Prepilin peptidase n=1 Tax=Alsobacter ponti TaxID=2962936 RepID=A0ABT1L8N6_9HYPH|nr:prepilin peptidase [Alsobacter ponti]